MKSFMRVKVIYFRRLIVFSSKDNYIRVADGEPFIVLLSL